MTAGKKSLFSPGMFEDSNTAKDVGGFEVL